MLISIRELAELFLAHLEKFRTTTTTTLYRHIRSNRELLIIILEFQWNRREIKKFFIFTGEMLGNCHHHVSAAVGSVARISSAYLLSASFVCLYTARCKVREDFLVFLTSDAIVRWHHGVVTFLQSKENPTVFLPLHHFSRRHFRFDHYRSVEILTAINKNGSIQVETQQFLFLIWGQAKITGHVFRVEEGGRE